MHRTSKYEPSADFVAKTMRRVCQYEASKTSLLKRAHYHALLRGNALAVWGALIGIFSATHAF
jgi:hypothetical protein